MAKFAAGVVDISGNFAFTYVTYFIAILLLLMLLILCSFPSSLCYLNRFYLAQF
jgi:hypothetical protein